MQLLARTVVDTGTSQPGSPACEGIRKTGPPRFASTSPIPQIPQRKTPAKPDSLTWQFRSREAKSRGEGWGAGGRERLADSESPADNMLEPFERHAVNRDYSQLETHPPAYPTKLNFLRPGRLPPRAPGYFFSLPIPLFIPHLSGASPTGQPD